MRRATANVRHDRNELIVDPITEIEFRLSNNTQHTISTQPISLDSWGGGGVGYGMDWYGLVWSDGATDVRDEHEISESEIEERTANKLKY